MLELLCAIVVAAAVAIIGEKAISAVQWPAFNSSNVTYALTTTAAVLCLSVYACAGWLERIGTWVWRAKAVSWIALSALVTSVLALPLGATKLYLGGISVDQQFRTEYLTRMTDSAGLHDMTYAGLPPYYPAGWFWLGGRFANLLGLSGWAAFKPYSVACLAVASVVALILWKLVWASRAYAAALAGVVAMLLYASGEPYSAVIAVMLAPMLVLLWRAISHSSNSTWHWAALITCGVYLGVAAAFYTLYTAIIALTVIVMSVLAITAHSVGSRKDACPSNAGIASYAIRIAGRVLVIAVISVTIALTVWAPYLARTLSAPTSTSGNAFHYLPREGAILPLPMLHWSLMGALALIGLAWIVCRVRECAAAQALAIGLVALYGWALLSMASTLAGMTLLGFRTEPVIDILFATAGACGVHDALRWLISRISVDMSSRATLLGVILCVAGAIAVTQTIPAQLSGLITTAYTDTDGNGVRADRRPPGAESYYKDIDKIITAATDRPRHDTIVLTADYGFLSIYPYYGFQGLTPHYANPLAEFNKRAALIQQWSHISSPNEMTKALKTAPWKAPNVFIFRSNPDGYTLRLASDTYPNDPNVKRYTVTFNPAAFSAPPFTVTTVGPFVIVIRK